MEYYDRLRKLRLERNKTQAEIAEYLQTGQSYYAKYENGRRALPLDRLCQLCLYYHVSADYILGLPEELPYPQDKAKRGRGKQNPS